MKNQPIQFYIFLAIALIFAMISIYCGIRAFVIRRGMIKYLEARHIINYKEFKKIKRDRRR